MAHVYLYAQTTREVPPAPMSETALAPTPLPVCCICGLIRDKTGSSSDRDRWVTPWMYQRTHRENPDDSSLTHTYCPECFTQVMGTVRRYPRKGCRFSPIPETQHRAKGETMTYEPNQIISRIQWCRLQQQLHSVTPDERAGWRAEEAGLVDALGCRDRIDFMREEYRSQFTRYQCGLEDGRALLRLRTVPPRGMTHMKERSPAPLTTQVNHRPSQGSQPARVDLRR